ncbi:MAG: ribonuclease H-like domain-containing protein [Elainellaceae cyanobacterium]
MRILRKQNIEDFLFFDIETAPLVGTEKELMANQPLFDAWEYHCIKNDIEDVVGTYFKEAPLHAEFARIACITIGVVRNEKIGLKTFSHEDEKQLLEEFYTVIGGFASNKTFLCGHVITGFDIPFIAKRSYAHRLLPHLLFDVAHLKPWEVTAMDTATLWKGTAFKMSTLISLCSALGVDSPKDDISGADVGRLYYEGEIERIVEYCEKDVIAVINVVRALRAEEPLEVTESTGPKKLGLLDYIFAGGEYTPEIAEMLGEALSSMNKTDKVRAIEILSALPTKAKGKETSITKKDIKALI